MDKIRVILGIDTETDCGSWTPYYEGVDLGVPILLDLFAREGATATFFFTGDAAAHYPNRAREILAAGHEVGCHSLFHETVGDEIFPIPGVKPLLPEEVPLRLATATDMVADAAGKRPVSYRAPRLWGSTAVVNGLEGLGYVADATYPLYHYRKQLLPYHPSRDNWLETGDSRVLEIPVFADIAKESNDPYGRDLDQWPLFRTENAEALMVTVRRFVEHVKGVVADSNAIPVLCFYFHPWEFIELPMQFHYGEGTVVPDAFLLENCGPYAIEQFRAFLRSLKAEYHTQFLTAGGLATLG